LEIRLLVVFIRIHLHGHVQGHKGTGVISKADDTKCNEWSD